MKSPKVAVIIRTRNRLILLDRAVSSVFSQSYKNFHITIVNDGGDISAIQNLINKYQQTEEKKISLINVSVDNRTEAINVGLKNSSSEFVVMLDDDDTWHEDFLKEATKILENTEYRGVVAGSCVINERIDKSKIIKISEEPFLSDIKSINLFNMLGSNQFPNMAFMYRRDVLRDVGYYDPTVELLEDWDFNIRFLTMYDIYFIDKVLCYYHRRPNIEGHLSNSIVSIANGHKNFNNYLLNRYLRNDLKKGSMGIGFIANLSQKMNYARSEDLSFLNTIIRQSTKETHDGINNLHTKVDKIDENIQNMNHKIQRLLTSNLKRYARGAIKRIRIDSR